MSYSLKSIGDLEFQDRYYVIWTGYLEGVFNDWNECKQYVIGYSGALYKSFKSYEAANKAYEMGYEEYMRVYGKGKHFSS